MRILLTGATGYIGGRLVPTLLEDGHLVKILVRDQSRLPNEPWVKAVEIIEGDVDSLDSTPTPDSLSGIDAAFYLIHSMKESSMAFENKELATARSFGRVAQKAGFQRIIYLGALGDPKEDLSTHLRSRHETGTTLADSGVPVIELRAGPVVGAGSLPFEMIRYLVERIPVMICPKWVYTKAQPISFSNVISYLKASLLVDVQGHKIIEIGGSDQLSYGDMMLGYARARGLKRKMIRVPVLTPRLSSYWVDWVTPIRSNHARPIVEGLRNEVIVRDSSARAIFPEITPMSYSASITEALEYLDPSYVIQSNPRPSSDSLVTSRKNIQGMIVENRRVRSKQTQEQLFGSVLKLGGSQGWYFDRAWKLRAAIDRLLGGVGLRRTKTGELPKVGDQLDFWRVASLVRNERLLLKAEMKLPGTAWLEFTVESDTNQGSILSQNSYFAPRGVAGILYWYALYPIHSWVFNGMAKRLASS